jgi:NAD(P)H dehydrogenase (quinone)
MESGQPDQTSVRADRPPILVTGATGRQGGSGRAVVRRLAEAGQPVRALVRTLDERAAALRELGAEVVVGDFADYPSLLAALEGVESAYFCYPVAPGIAEAAGLFATAGRERGLRRVVDLSLAATRPDHPSPQARAQWVAEQIFEWAGFGGVHLRIAAFFMENLLAIDAAVIRTEGRLANSFGSLELPWLSGSDVGALAAALLLDPGAVTERVLVAGGAERLAYPELARIISEVAGRPVHYEELTPDAWHGELVARSAAAGGEANVRGADHLVAQSRALRANPIPALADRVAELTGSAPVTFRRFVELHRAELAG